MGKYANTPQKKGSKKGLIIALAVILAILVAAVGAAGFLAIRYHIIDAKLYLKDSETLDLRGQEIKQSHFDKISEKMPDCEVRWDIPFQGGVLADDAREVTVTALSEKDIAMLAYAHQLETVNAEGCTDYETLEMLRQQRPDLNVVYSVAFSGGNYSWDVETLLLNSVSQEDIQQLRHLPNLKTVVLAGGSYDVQTVEALREAARSAGLQFALNIGSEMYQDTETALQVSDATDEDLQLLQFVTALETLELQNPKADPQRIFALQESMPNVAVSWSVVLGDQRFDNTVTHVDLTMVEVTDLAEVEQKMQYLPNLQQVTFGVCGKDNADWDNSRSQLAASPIPNEDMSAYRDRVRDQYKVVWTVRLGPSIAIPTDKDNFMPNHFGVGQLPDSYAYNLRYCEEMVCLDVGHMTLTDISFVEFMPNLKYLILAWTEVQYIEPIRSCKNLVFLELDHSCIRDISPLVDCTALEDLNLGMTYCDIEPLLEMPWLKNVYMILRSKAGVVGMGLPDTRVVTSNDPDAATVGYGWRRLPNYYDMRDCLNVPYMN